MKEFSVFVLDDDLMFCELLCALARHTVFTSKLSDYKVTFVTYSDMKKIDEAVDCIKKMQPDLVLLDYMLGTEAGSCIDSLGFLRNIIPYCSNIQVMSGLYLDDIRLKLIKKTLADTHIGFLPKPFDVEALVCIIKECIQRKGNGQHC